MLSLIFALLIAPQIHQPICEAFADAPAPLQAGQRVLWDGDPWGVGNAHPFRGVKATVVSVEAGWVILRPDPQLRQERSLHEQAHGINPLCSTSPQSNAPATAYTVGMSIEVARRDTRLLRRDGRVERRMQ